MQFITKKLPDESGSFSLLFRCLGGLRIPSDTAIIISIFQDIPITLLNLITRVIRSVHQEL